MTTDAARPARHQGIRRVGIVGAGVMGTGIGQILALSGREVTLVDARPGAAETARGKLAGTFNWLAGKGKITREAAGVAASRVHAGGSLSALDGADLVIEAIVEDLASKRDLFERLEHVVRADCTIATNTSSLSVTAIAAGLERPARVAGMHFFNPVPLMKVVEVIAGERTDPALCDTLAALVESMGHTPVRCADTPGFIVNHGGRGYGTEALRVLGEGIAPASAIDRIMRAAGFRMGPFELLDLTGLDVSHPVMESIYEQYYHEPRFRPSPVTRRRTAAGLLGRKTGRGFYVYREGEAQQVPEPPVPDSRPAKVYLHHDASTESPARALLETLAAPVTDSPDGDQTLCIVTPLGQDATSACLAAGLNPSRTVALDTLFGLDTHRTVMTTPATSAAMRLAAHGLFAGDGTGVSVINDSPGFVAPRIVAMIVSIACEMAQQQVASPRDIDLAMRLGLGYPWGPLSWGDRLGAPLVLSVLTALHDSYADPRYRPSPWLRRRAALGLSLLAPERA